MNLTLAEAAQAAGGRLLPPAAAETRISAVDIDTRRLPPQALFAALAGGQRDGHDFLPQAQAAGAAAALVSRRQESALPQLLVDDTAAALQRLARFWRRRSNARIVAITGSNGKTTVKEMLHSIMRAAAGDAAALASAGNFNNHLGVPLTLLRLTDAHKFAAVEAGMDAAGELAELSALIQPQAALINNAQRAHIGNFKSLEDIARAKGEILQGLAADGIAALNADDAHYPLWRRLAGERRILSFGASERAEVRGAVTADGLLINNMPVTLSVPGAHNKHNALAAAAAAIALGLPEDAIVRGLAAYRGAPGRLTPHALAHDTLLIDDSYNANPDSAAAALAALEDAAARRGAKPLLIMGDMLALGDAAAAAHRELAAACAERSVTLFGVGEAMRAAINGGGGAVFYDDRAALIAEAAAAARREKMCILVKGSRGLQMENIVAGLMRALEGGG